MVAAPVGFATQLQGKGEVNLTGWVRLWGEVMLYVSREAMQSKLHYPSCISGVFKNQADQTLSGIDGKKVVISGQLYKFSSLSEEDAPLLQREVLGGSVIPNCCFGENVLLVRKIDLAR